MIAKPILKSALKSLIASCKKYGVDFYELLDEHSGKERILSDKYKIIRATFTQDFIVEMIDDERTKINGWTIEEVIEDWFKRHPFDSHHVTREGHRIGNSKKLLNTEIIKSE